MRIEILSLEQKKLLSLLKSFNNEYYLVGGTAIALHLGHRRSIDFDLFTEKELKFRAIENHVKRNKFDIEQVFNRTIDEFTFITNGVKLSFVSFPFNIKADENFNNIIRIPNLLILAAMKAYALGRRSKWKDYIDMYFILHDHFSIELISAEAERIFQGSFNSRLFREQLIWFENMDFSETVDFTKGYEVSDTEVKKFLLKVVTK